VPRLQRPAVLGRAFVISVELLAADIVWHRHFDRLARNEIDILDHDHRRLQKAGKIPVLGSNVTCAAVMIRVV
jgi:hypothetical protein